MPTDRPMSGPLSTSTPRTTTTRHRSSLQTSASFWAWWRSRLPRSPRGARPSSEVRPTDFKTCLADAQQATVLAKRALEDGRFEEAELLARCGAQHAACRARCVYLLAMTFHRWGAKAAAQRTAEELLEA